MYRYIDGISIFIYHVFAYLCHWIFKTIVFTILCGLFSKYWLFKEKSNNMKYFVTHYKRYISKWIDIGVFMFYVGCCFQFIYCTSVSRSEQLMKSRYGPSSDEYNTDCPVIRAGTITKRTPIGKLGEGWKIMMKFPRYSYSHHQRKEP